MKKYLIIAAAVILAAACAKTYEVKETTTPSIGFGTWAETLTRARVQGSNTFTSGDDFAVYGYKAMSDDSAPATVFDDDVVRTTDGTTWTYTTPRYWDSNYDKYIFYAVSPSAIGTEADGTNSSTDVNPQTGAFVTRAITFNGKNNDILVADKKTVNKTDGSGNFNSYGIVPLVFNHVASLVDFKVKKAPGLHDATVTVSAFELSDIDNVGQLTVSSAYTDSHPVATWTEPGTARESFGPGDGVTPVDISSPIAIAEDTDFDPSNPADTPAASTDLITSLIVMPQTFRASDGTNPQKITLTYKIEVSGSADTEFADKVIYLNQFDFEDDDYNSTASYHTGWKPGKHYVFYITLDAHKIDFSATITDWSTTDANGYHYLVN